MRNSFEMIPPRPNMPLASSRDSMTFGSIVDYLLLTALDDEASALEWAFKNVGAQGPSRHRSTGAPTHFRWTLKHPRGNLTVAAASLIDMGNDAAGDYTQQLLRTLAPTYLGFVGIAGAARDEIAPGSILLADRIWHYEPAKLKSDSVTIEELSTQVEGCCLID